jgi:hypothetical protein
VVRKNRGKSGGMGCKANVTIVDKVRVGVDWFVGVVSVVVDAVRLTT